MEEQTAVAIAEPSEVAEVIEEQPPTVTVVARSAAQMASAQARLVSWCEWKLKEVHSEAEEVNEAIADHKRRKWSTSVLNKVGERIGEQVVFYEKIRDALMAGYYLVPNVDADVFVIRTRQNAAVPRITSTEWTAREAINSLGRVGCNILPAGDGESHSPDVKGKVEYVSQENDYRRGVPAGTKSAAFHARATKFSKIEFPFSLAMPEVVDATNDAMALKIFDELAISPTKARKNEPIDPMIVGRIYKGWNRNSRNGHVSFLVAWWFDTEVLL